MLVGGAGEREGDGEETTGDGDAHGLHEAGGAELALHGGATGADGDDGEAELVGDLSGGQAGGEELEDGVFGGGDGGGAGDGHGESPGAVSRSHGGRRERRRWT